MIKKNYYGLKHGEYLGYNIGRNEKYYYCIFTDGSECVQVETETGRRYHFGNIEYCRRMYKVGYCFNNENITKSFKKALCA